MATEVQLPQLGESVTEGVITAWLVEVGDDVDVDQPIAEISTDKVDTEIPSPVAGTVAELKADVDDTIEVGQVIAVIEGGGSEDGADEEADGEEQADEDDADKDDGDKGDADKDDADKDDGDEDDAGEDDGEDQDTDTTGERADQDREAETDDKTESADAEPSKASGGNGQVEGAKALTSPLVRKLLREAGIEPSQVKGTGAGGRITREDAQRAIASGGEAPAESAEAGGDAARPAVTPPPPLQLVSERSRPEPSPTQIDFGGELEVTQDLTRVRKIIAKSMLESLQTTAQLTAAVEVDLTSMMNLRAAKKDAFKAKEGASLSPLPMIARAVCMVIPRHPTVNSSIDTDAGTATFHNYINLGMAVDTERGLLVPNIKDAHDLNVPGMARKIVDIATRARNKKLQPDEISGGTFTITNTGSRGTLFDTPILNPPETAILATCAIEKRPVVVSDAYGDSIAIRWMTYLCMTYDHRMLDGADAARFLQDLKYVLETHDFASELGV